MQGLVNRAIQCFVRDNYGWSLWEQVVRRAELGFSSFEAMLDYDPVITGQLCTALEAVLNKPLEILLEDLGTYLVSHSTTSALRRLLRFGGANFEDFLLSLDDLPEKARFALPDVDLPKLHCKHVNKTQFMLLVSPGLPGFGAVMVGVLRAMADDYGALVFLEREVEENQDVIRITLADAAFAKGRGFNLAASVGAVHA